jgi:hypothetical protein
MRARHASRLSLAALAALSALVMGGMCDSPPSIRITSPLHGIFTTDASVTVTGVVKNIAVANASVRVNGVVVALNPDKTFSRVLALDPDVVFNPITAELTRLDVGGKFVDRHVVIVGDSIPDGGYSTEAVALRLNDTGLDKVEPIITSQVPIDPADLLPPGTQIIDEFCAATLFGLCIQTADAFVSGTPPPSVGSVSIDADSMTSFVAGDVGLTDLFVRADVRNGSVGIIPFSCHVNINADTTAILGDYALEPLAADPNFVDVTQIGGVDVVFGNFSDTRDCDGIFGFLIEFFLNLLITDLQALVEPEFEAFLNDPDGAGPQDAAVADAIETALAGISIQGPVGEALQVTFDAPLFTVPEDPAGLTLGADASFTTSVGTGPGQCLPPPGAPDFAASYHVSESFPPFGGTFEDPQNPGTFIPYDLAVASSTSAFNQLLKAMVECGLLTSSFSEIDLGFGAEPITAGLLSVLIPQLSGLDPGLALEIRLRPTIAPVVTGNPGPDGEQAELRVANLIFDIVAPGMIGDALFLSAAADVRIGLGAEFDEETGALMFLLSEPAPSDITVVITANPLNTNSTALQNALPIVLAPTFPSLSAALGSLPLPTFFGLGLDALAVMRNGAFLTIFANFVPAP